MFPLLVSAAATQAASAATVYSEDFNTDGAGSRYIVTGGGGSGDDFWGLASIGNSLGFSGQEGADFFAGRDMDGVFAGGANPLTVELPATGDVNLSGVTSATLSIRLAASSITWDAGQDFLRIVAINTATTAESVLVEFLPNLAGNLESQDAASVVLDSTFVELSFAIPASIDQLALRIEAFSTGDTEFMGFDDVLILTPEPGTLLLVTTGLVLLGGRRRARRA